MFPINSLVDLGWPGRTVTSMLGGRMILPLKVDSGTGEGETRGEGEGYAVFDVEPSGLAAVVVVVVVEVVYVMLSSSESTCKNLGERTCFISEVFDMVKRENMLEKERRAAEGIHWEGIRKLQNNETAWIPC